MIKVINQKNRVDDKVSQQDIDDLYQEIVALTVEFEKDLKTRVNERFAYNFDEMGKQVYESDEKLQRLKDRKYELETLIKELQNVAEQEDERDDQLNEADLIGKIYV